MIYGNIIDPSVVGRLGVREEKKKQQSYVIGKLVTLTNIGMIE